jgi:hypothetical protein
MAAIKFLHEYEVRPRKDKRGVDLISDVLPFGRLWYGEPNAINNAIGYAQHHSRSHHAVIRVYDAGKIQSRHPPQAPTGFAENISAFFSSGRAPLSYDCAPTTDSVGVRR